MLKIIACIHEQYPRLEIQNLGETDIIVTYENQKTPPLPWHILKVGLVSAVIFFGSAFSIMAFNNDVGVTKLFGQIYELIMGKKTDGFSVLEVTYSIGLAIGIFLAFVYSYKNQCTKSFVTTLALLPSIVCVVIMMVNGNIGAGVAVAGAFSLVRFRSVPGSAKEICSIFMAMGTGLVAGMGYLGFAVVFALILGVAFLICNLTNIGLSKSADRERSLRITIPEDLDYTNMFDDLLKKYTTNYKMLSAKTTNMGSMFKLTYHVTLRNPSLEKEFIDALRCRNGNLEIMLSTQEATVNEL